MGTAKQMFNNRRCESPLRVSSKCGKDDVLLEVHIDPKYKDIVLNGMGISLYAARQIAGWFDSAVRQLEKREN